MPFPILAGKAIVDTGYNIENSCRFDDGASDNMRKTFGSGGTTVKWTFSTWLKRGNISISNPQTFFAGQDDGSTYTNLDIGTAIGAGDQLRWSNSDLTGSLITTQLLRDPSAWYHIVFAYDSGQATASNRNKMYINGVRITAFDTETNANEDAASYVNANTEFCYIGVYDYDDSGGSQKFDGYLAETILIDNQALDPTSFGEFDDDSPTIWKPIDISGLDVGTQGFYLDYKDSSAMGNDASGGADFTLNNIDATNQCTDTPTNNFATMNPLAGNGTYTEGNLIVTGGNNVVSTFGVTAGRWYCECKITLASGALYPLIGIADSGNIFATDPGASGYPGSHTPSYGIFGNGSLYANGSNEGDQAFSDFADNDIIGMYLDLDSGTKTIKWHVNGTEVATDNITAPDNAYVFGHYTGGESTVVGKWNFGNPTSALSSANSDPNGYGSFEYSTSESSIDYYALCTKNLAEYGG